MDVYKNLNGLTVETLPEYLKTLEQEFPTYNNCPDIVAKSGLAAMWAFSNKLGITGFQASFALWSVIFNWQYSNNKCGLKLINLDDMLYPQYADKFDKIINKDTWEALQKEAKVRLNEVKDGPASNRVIAHWESIVAGIVPFGYRIEEE